MTPGAVETKRYIPPFKEENGNPEPIVGKESQRDSTQQIGNTAATLRDAVYGRAMQCLKACRGQRGHVKGGSQYQGGTRGDQFLSPSQNEERAANHKCIMECADKDACTAKTNDLV